MYTISYHNNMGYNGYDIMMIYYVYNLYWNINGSDCICI